MSKSWRISSKLRCESDGPLPIDDSDSLLFSMFEAFITIAQSGRENVKAVVKAITKNVEGLV